MIAVRVAVAAVMIAAAGMSDAAPAPRFRISPDHLMVAPGATVQLRAAPPTDPRAEEPYFKEVWYTLGPGSLDRTGLYGAPYVVSSSAIVRVVLARGFKPQLDSAEALIELEPGDFNGAQDCLGPGQTWGPTGRSPDGARLDELPIAIHTVAPEYPASARARGLSGGLVVNALVCRSGRVLDAYATWPLGTSPIRELERAALDAARQSVFRPGSAGGQPVAALVAIPFRFPPP